MKILTVISMLFLLGLQGKAQDTVVVYMNQDYEAVQKENAVYVREAVVANERFYITDKLADGTIYNYYELSSLDPQIYDGLSIAYDSNYNIYAKGKYNDNVLSGQWIYYNDSTAADTVFYPALTTDEKVHKAKYYKKSRKTKEVGYEILDSLSSFMKANFHLPPRARETDDRFLARIKFIIGKDGEITGQEIMADNSRIMKLHKKDEKILAKPVNPAILHPDIHQEIVRILDLFRYRHSARKSMGITINFPYPVPKETPGEEVYTVVEDMPEFINKKYKNHIGRYVRENLSDEFADCEGKAWVSFIVDKDGSIQSTYIVHGIEDCEGYEEEIDRVLKACPPWKPGKQRGKAVKVQFMMPVEMGNQ